MICLTIVKCARWCVVPAAVPCAAINRLYAANTAGLLMWWMLLCCTPAACVIPVVFLIFSAPTSRKQPGVIWLRVFLLKPTGAELKSTCGI